MQTQIGSRADRVNPAENITALQVISLKDLKKKRKNVRLISKNCVSRSCAPRDDERMYDPRTYGRTVRFPPDVSLWFPLKRSFLMKLIH